MNAAKKVRFQRYHNGNLCPECGNEDYSTIEDNGCRHPDRSYLCTKCGNQWDAAQFEIS